MKHSTLFIIISIFLFLFLSSCFELKKQEDESNSSSSSTEITVSGTVKDSATDSGVSNLDLSLVGTSATAKTDDTGNYSLTATTSGDTPVLKLVNSDREILNQKIGKTNNTYTLDLTTFDYAVDQTVDLTAENTFTHAGFELTIPAYRLRYKNNTNNSNYISGTHTAKVGFILPSSKLDVQTNIMSHARLKLYRDGSEVSDVDFTGTIKVPTAHLYSQSRMSNYARIYLNSTDCDGVTYTCGEGVGNPDTVYWINITDQSSDTFLNEYTYEMSQTLQSDGSYSKPDKGVCYYGSTSYDNGVPSTLAKVFLKTDVEKEEGVSTNKWAYIVNTFGDGSICFVAPKNEIVAFTSAPPFGTSSTDLAEFTKYSWAKRWVVPEDEVAPDGTTYYRSYDTTVNNHTLKTVCSSKTAAQNMCYTNGMNHVIGNDAPCPSADFLGVDVPTKGHLVFILDFSGSMSGTIADGRTRKEAIQDEFEETIRAISHDCSVLYDDEYKFTVVTFGKTTTLWDSGFHTPTDDNKNAAIDWVNDAASTPSDITGTNYMEALYAAQQLFLAAGLKWEDSKTIYFFTDGGMNTPSQTDILTDLNVLDPYCSWMIFNWDGPDYVSTTDWSANNWPTYTEMMETCFSQQALFALGLAFNVKIHTIKTGGYSSILDYISTLGSYNEIW